MEQEAESEDDEAGKEREEGGSERWHLWRKVVSWSSLWRLRGAGVDGRPLLFATPRTNVAQHRLGKLSDALLLHPFRRARVDPAEAPTHLDPSQPLLVLPTQHDSPLLLPFSPTQQPLPSIPIPLLLVLLRLVAPSFSTPELLVPELICVA